MLDQMGLPVLAGFDGSPASVAAVELAADEAAARVCPLVIVHVFGGRIRPPTETCAPPWDDPVATWRWRLDQIASAICADRPGLAVDSELLVGDTTEILLDRSRESCLLVLGSRRRSGVPVGSVATRVPERAAVPVIVHRPLEWRYVTTGPRPVLVGVEAAAAAEPAVSFGFLEASLRGAPLTALHLWSRPAHAAPAGVQPDAYGFAGVRAEEERRLAEALAGWSEKYPEVPVHRMVRHSLDPAVTLAEASRSAQLVVVGAAQSPGRGRLVLGSVHQTLADHAGCPVAVVPTDIEFAE
ncbi:MAG TPA: universal stress protein [Micromonosporaceae bacterium]